VRRRRRFVPVTVRENLNWEEVARIEVNAPDLPGVMIDVGESRYYPYGEETAHVLGYVAAVSEDEINGDDPLLELPGFRIGKAGIEKVYDRELRGTGGSSQVEVNALGRVIRELSRQEGEPGAEVVLTIDLALQKMVTERLAGESAAAVVIDVRTGDVLALASTPGYDPNAFNKGLSTEEWKALITNPRTPLIDKAIAGQYPPGSTFKTIVALAALEKGVISPSATVFCPGYLRFGKALFHCWKRGGHGNVDMIRAITESCDVYFYEVARRTGIDRIAAMAERFGLGKTLGLDLPGEQPGLVPTRDWKRATLDEPWHKGETLITGIGQGYLLTTPLQLAVMVARLANGGYAVVPRLARQGAPAKGEKGDGAPPGPRLKSMGLSSSHLNIVLTGTRNVVNSPHGTARRARIKEEGFEMGGKTGTVQVKRITKAEREQGLRKNKDLPWKDRDHAIFIGYAPVQSPRYAVSVLVEHGGGGSHTAAPIARDILLEAQRRDSARPGKEKPAVRGRGSVDSGKIRRS